MARHALRVVEGAGGRRRRAADDHHRRARRGRRGPVLGRGAAGRRGVVRVPDGAEAVRERWPALRFPADAEIFVQEDGGVCRAERTVLAQARLAARARRDDPRGRRWSSVSVPPATAWRSSPRTARSCRAPVAVVTAGPWAACAAPERRRRPPARPELRAGHVLRAGRALAAADGDRLGRRPGADAVLGARPGRAGALQDRAAHVGPAADADARSFDPDPVRVERCERYAPST